MLERKARAVALLADAVEAAGLEARAAALRACGTVRVAVAQRLEVWDEPAPWAPAPAPWAWSPPTSSTAPSTWALLRTAHGVVSRSYVCGEHGLAVCEVDECGHRLCPMCARRASARNRRRILERVAALDETAKNAQGLRLVRSRSPGVDDDGALEVGPTARALEHAQRALAVVVEHTAAADPDTWQLLAETQGAALRESATLADAAASRLAAHRAAVGVLRRWLPALVPSLNEGVTAWTGDLFGEARVVGDVDMAATPRARATRTLGEAGAEAFARDVRDAIARFRARPVGRVDGVDIAVGACSPVPSSHASQSVVSRRETDVIAARYMRADAGAAVDKAARALDLAQRRQEAAALLARVEAWPRIKGVRDVEERARAARALVFASQAITSAVHGPVALWANERAAWRAQASKLVDGVDVAVDVAVDVDGRSVVHRGRTLSVILASMARVHDAARARLEASFARALADDAEALTRQATRSATRLERDRAKARRAAAQSKLWRSKDVRFWTLTQRAATHETAREALARVLEVFRHFTRSRWWARRVAGAIVHVEIEWSTPRSRARRVKNLNADAKWLRLNGHDEAAAWATDEARKVRARDLENAQNERGARSWWHAHVHVAAAAGYVDALEIAAAWSSAARKVTRWTQATPSTTSTTSTAWEAREAAPARVVVDGAGNARTLPAVLELVPRLERDVDVDAVDVDVDAVVVGARSGRSVNINVQKPRRGVKGVLNEVTKYLTKPLKYDDMPKEKLSELVDAVRGRQLTRCLGALRGVALENQGAAPSTKLEGATGDGEAKPLGYVDDPDKARWQNDPKLDEHTKARALELWGARPVFAAPVEDAPRHWHVVEWEESAEAREFWRLCHIRADQRAADKRAAVPVTPQGQEVTA